MAFTNESDLEEFLVEELITLGNMPIKSAKASPEAKPALRASYHQTILEPILMDALAALNPELPQRVLVDAAKRLMDVEFSTDLILENQRVHRLMVDGIKTSFVDNGEERSAHVQLIDWTDQKNDWRVISQFDVVGASMRTPDVVVFLNGMPLVVIELKGTEGKDIEAAFNQIQTYKAEIPDLFRTVLINVISDGFTARYGSLSANLDRYMNWRTIDGKTLVPAESILALETLAKGLLCRPVLLDLLRWCTVFEEEGDGPVKKIAGYHQFFAIRKALDSVIQARDDDGKGGVIWHTQGSGKSLLMVFLAGRLMHDPALENPTILVLTDRNDLDNQLFATFGRCRAILGEEPVQAEEIPDVIRLLDRKAGGIVFSTIQKFRPKTGSEAMEITTRSNVVVLVDEAHRTQYGFDAKITSSGDVRFGLAYQLRKALPNAVYVAFTGTPIELVGADTRAIFGDYIDTYKVAQAVEDGATVPIHYEARIARIGLDEELASQIDDEFKEAIEGLPEDDAERATRKWSQVEALFGSDKRLDMVVDDLLLHFDGRLQAIDGKAMIVCMSRKICVEVYDRIIAARPDWHGDTDDLGAVKVIMTGGAEDPPEMRPHIRSKARQEAIRTRYRNPDDPLKLVIVCDMWLTGFDAPCMHTLYVDKPMRGHNLMQAIARVNRIFEGKPAGLVVDYAGIATDLKRALAYYAQSDQDQTRLDPEEAITALRDALDVMRGQFYGFDYEAAITGTAKDRLRILPPAIDFVLGKGIEDDGTSIKRFKDGVAALSKAFKLASGSEVAAEHAIEVGFFIAVETGIRKLDADRGRKSSSAADAAIRQLINDAVTSTEVVDVLAACGFERPDISILTDEFMLGLQEMEHKNLAVEALKKLLNDEISARARSNVVKSEEFSKRLAQAIARYHNRSVDALQVIQELIDIARDLRDQPEDGLTEEERAFYDALAQNRSAVEVMSNDKLRLIATELVNTVRSNSGTDWWKRENVRARMRVAVRRILKSFGYPPDLTTEAVQTVLKQAEALAAEISR